MPQMKALKTFRVSETGKVVHAGDTFSVKEGNARHYDDREMAVRLEKQAKVASKETPAAAEASAPLASTRSPRGSRIGPVKPLLSSALARAPKKPTSRKRGK